MRSFSAAVDDEFMEVQAAAAHPLLKGSLTRSGSSAPRTDAGEDPAQVAPPGPSLFRRSCLSVASSLVDAMIAMLKMYLSFGGDSLRVVSNHCSEHDLSAPFRILEASRSQRREELCDPAGLPQRTRARRPEQARRGVHRDGARHLAAAGASVSAATSMRTPRRTHSRPHSHFIRFLFRRSSS